MKVKLKIGIKVKLKTKIKVELYRLEFVISDGEEREGVDELCALQLQDVGDVVEVQEQLVHMLVAGVAAHCLQRRYLRRELH